MSKAPEQQQVKDFTSWPVSWPAQIKWAVSIVFKLTCTWTDNFIKYYFQMTTSLASLNTGIAKFRRWQAVATDSCDNSNRRILKASHIVMSLVVADDIALVGIFLQPVAWKCARSLFGIGRSPSLGACSFHTKPISRHFYREVCFLDFFSREIDQFIGKGKKLAASGVHVDLTSGEMMTSVRIVSLLVIGHWGFCRCLNLR